MASAVQQTGELTLSAIDSKAGRVLHIFAACALMGAIDKKIKYVEAKSEILKSAYQVPAFELAAHPVPTDVFGSIVRPSLLASALAGGLEPKGPT